MSCFVATCVSSNEDLITCYFLDISVTKKHGGKPLQIEIYTCVTEKC